MTKSKMFVLRAAVFVALLRRSRRHKLSDKSRPTDNLPSAPQPQFTPVPGIVDCTPRELKSR